MDRRTIARTALALFALHAVPQGWTQTAGPGAAIQEVVVTARKVEESLQEVPLAITAITSEQIAERSIRTLSDIAALTPGLNFEDYLGGNGTPVIRGAAQARIQDLDQNVSTFFDGIYLPRQYVVNPGVVGLERVEVVKGPQSALYGRNAFMGAINYITRKPGDEWEGSIEGTVGGDERYDIIGDVGGPVIPGKLFVRVGGGYSEFDGDIENGFVNADTDIYPGSSGNLNGWRNQAVQGRVVFRPIETLEFDVGIHSFKLFQETPAIIRVQQSTNDTNCGRVLPSGRSALYCGELPWQFSPLPGNTNSPDVAVDARSYGLDMDSTIFRGHVEWAATDSLDLVYEFGRLTARAVGGGSSDRDPFLGSVNIFNPMGPRGAQFQFSPAGDVSYSSHELRAEFAPSERLELMLGGFASELNDFDYFPLASALPLYGTTPTDVNSPGFFILSRGRTDVDAWAIFGRASWRFNDQWRVGAEARYAEEDKTLINGPSSFNPAVRGLNDRWYAFTPRFTLDYQPTDDMLLYASVAKGVKSGGFNLSALIPAEAAFDEDENWTYELGSKNTLLDGRLQLNAAIFYIDWKNQQVSCSASGSPINISPPAIICNLGAANIKGLELEGIYALTDALSFSLGASYNDAQYDDGVVDQRIRDFRYCDDIVCPANGDIGGNDLTRQSKVQATVGAQFETPVSDALRFFANGDVSYKSKQYADTMNLAYVPERTLVNLRLGVRHDAWEVALWSKNLLDEEYPASAFAITVATDVNYVPIVGARRTYGLTARYNFGAR